MEPHFTFRDIEPSDGLKDHASQKMDKLEKYLIKPIWSHDLLNALAEYLS